MRESGLGNAFKYAFAVSAGVGLAGAAVAGTVKAVKSGAHRLILRPGGGGNDVEDLNVLDGEEDSVTPDSGEEDS